jgi:radical SAM-linked protein
MQFASGLPLGTSGRAEILDIILTEQLAPEQMLTRIREALPRGIGLQAVAEVPLKITALQQRLRQADYRVRVETALPPETIRERIAALLAAEQVIQTRRRRGREEEYDLRPWLHELRLEAVGEGEIELQMRVTAGQFGNLRPEAILKALDLADNWAEIERTRLIFEDPVDGYPPDQN